MKKQPKTKKLHLKQYGTHGNAPFQECHRAHRARESARCRQS